MLHVAPSAVAIANSLVSASEADLHAQYPKLSLELLPTLRELPEEALPGHRTGAANYTCNVLGDIRIQVLLKTLAFFISAPAHESAVVKTRHVRWSTFSTSSMQSGLPCFVMVMRSSDQVRRAKS